tara:strand:- start:1712 stop:2260 length:549 start_codon:yes stop_codon:yes gene_type:complete
MRKIWIIFLLLFAMGCGKNYSQMSLEGADAPKWVIEGNAAFEDKAYYGIGSASNFKNYSLRRLTADNRARNDLAKRFEIVTQSLMKDYEASLASGQDVSEERNVEQAIRTVTNQTLSGIIVIDHWEHESRGELFSLARLDMEEFKKNLEKNGELSEKAKTSIIEKADKLHKELKDELSRRSD